MAAKTSNAREVEMTTATTARALRAICFHGSEELYLRNQLQSKIEALGLNVVSLIVTGKVPVDVSQYDVVLYIDSSTPSKSVSLIRSEAARARVPIFALDHRRSSSTWERLQLWLASARVVEEETTRARPRARLAEAPPPETTASKLVRGIEENEKIAALALQGEEEARAKLAAAEREIEDLRLQAEAERNSTGAAVRDQLMKDVSRKEAERVAAVQAEHRTREELTRRLEAAEREKRDEVAAVAARLDNVRDALARAKGTAADARDEVERLRGEIERLTEEALSATATALPGPPAPAAPDPRVARVRKIADAWVDEIVDADAAMKKVFEVVSKGGG